MWTTSGARVPYLSPTGARCMPCSGCQMSRGGRSAMLRWYHLSSCGIPRSHCRVNYGISKRPGRRPTRPASIDASTHHPDRSAGHPGPTAPHHGPFEEKALAFLGVPPQSGPMPVVHMARILEASSRAQPGASGAATARVERPDEGPQEITIAVPGISERRLHCPALAPAKQDDRPVSTAEEVEGAAREREHPTSIRSTQPAERGGLSSVERPPTLASHLMAESEAGAIGRLQGQVE